MKVKSIEFGFLSPKMVKDMSAIKIEQPELYDPDGYPIDGGLADLHLGVVDPGLRGTDLSCPRTSCIRGPDPPPGVVGPGPGGRTGGGTIGQCLGHFGYLELTKPIVHPLYGKKIYMLLKAICRKCSVPLVPKDEAEKIKGNRLTHIYKKKLKTCPACGEKQKDITYFKPTSYREGNTDLTSEEVRQRLEKITDDDLALLRIKCRPEWLIRTILPVPPVTVRPSITLETGERSEDDLTHKLVDIVRINEDEPFGP